jgi:putative ABC transport system substrate-binding protein
MRRREVVAGLAGGWAAFCTLHARAQQSVSLIGFLHSGTAEQNATRLAEFHKGLSAAGFVEGQNLAHQ